MNLSDIAIRRPVFTTMMSMVLVVLGLLSFGRLGTELYPPVDLPVLTVLVVYPGAGPEDIERDVVEPLEEAVSGISGLDAVQSFTRDNSTFLVLKFEMETELEAATNQVRDRIGRVAGSLPEGAHDPVIQQIDIGALPVLVGTVSSPGGVNATRNLVEERLKPALEQIDGVGAVNVIGGQDREIHVDLDLDKLAALGLSATQVAERVGYENVSVPVGDVGQGSFDVGIRAEGAYDSVDDLRNTVIQNTPDGRMVRLGDVALIEDGFSRPERYVRTNQDEAVAVEIVKKAGANTVEVCKEANRRLAELVPQLTAGARYELISDQSLDIEANAHEVWIAIWFGGAIAILVILFFLLDVRGTIISSMALPTSVIGTFAAMYALDFSINTMTLLGLSLAIGLLIDDAVVVRESITRRLEAGDEPEEAASRGTREIALAVFATTMSLVAVFVPVAFMSGIIGQFFKQFGLTLAVAVMISLFVAFTLDPMLSARLATKVEHHEHGVPGAIRRFLDRVDAGYLKILDGALGRPGLTIGAAILTLVGAFATAAMLPVEFVPKEDRGEILAEFRLPAGTSLEATDAQARIAEDALMGIPDVERVYTIVGHENIQERARFRVRVVSKDKRTEPLEVYEAKVRAELSKIPQADVYLSQPAIIEGLGDFPPLMVILQGPDLDGLLQEGRRLRDALKAVPGSSDVRLSVDPQRPELVVDIDRQAAADRYVPAGLVGMTARLLVDGSVVGNLRDGGQEADIRVRSHGRFRDDFDAIRALPLPSPRGKVTLGDVAKLEVRPAPSTINHYNRMRALTISAQVAPGGALGSIVDGFYAELAKNPLPEGYFLTLDGQARDMKDTAAAMGLAILVAFVFIYMVLASQFESFLHPFTLMVSVPLALVGAFGALALTGSSISMGSQIGVILLMGLVTKNAILLVDGALLAMREQDLSPVDAMRYAGPRRLRPILMTSFAMALGMVPTAVGTGVGAEFRAPMAIVVIGGVVSSSVLTLVVVPVIFLWMERLRRWTTSLGQKAATPVQVVAEASK